MKKAVGCAITMTMLVFCQHHEVATDFYEIMPEERVSKLVTGTPEPRGIQGQMLIKKASVRFEVADYIDARKKIENVIEKRDAYISSERESKSDYRISNSMQIRVMATQFEMTIDSLVGQSKKLDEKSITVEDVTEEFVDTKARLSAKKQIEGRYLEILKKAHSVKDILEVEQKLGEIREEIESQEGRVKYLTHQVSYSTIELSIYQDFVAAPETSNTFLSELSVSFLSGWRGLTEFFLGLVSIWPFLVIMTGISSFTYAFIKRIQSKKGPR